MKVCRHMSDVIEQAVDIKQVFHPVQMIDYQQHKDPHPPFTTRRRDPKKQGGCPAPRLLTRGLGIDADPNFETNQEKWSGKLGLGNRGLGKGHACFQLQLLGVLT